MMQPTVMRHMRCAVALAVAVVLGAGTATAQPAGDVTARGNQLAYAAALKCFVANGVATGEREDAGDREAAARYERTARKSFDTAMKLGGVLGYSGSRINQDLGLAQASQLPKLVKDVSYYRSTAATCRALGLM